MMAACGDDEKDSAGASNGGEQGKDNYTEQQGEELRAIDDFIRHRNITIISETEFKAQNYRTDVTKNEFVYLMESGVYMQIVRKGNGTELNDGEKRTVYVEYKEQNILDTTAVTGNYTNPYKVDEMELARVGDTYTAMFTKGLMLDSYGSAVPAGWLKVFPFIKIGRPVSEDDEVAMVRLIVPHTQGHQKAASKVIPYYYEIALQQAEEVYEESTVENYWNSLDDFNGVLSGCYMKSVRFEDLQLGLESLRTMSTETVHAIMPHHQGLLETYHQAYNTISMTNVLLHYAKEAVNNGSLDKESLTIIIAQAQCLRAFTYYNLAMLWGDVILVTKPILSIEDMEDLIQSSQADVYQFTLAEVSEAIDKLPSSYSTERESKGRFTRHAALMLKAEIELTLGHNEKAQQTLEGVDWLAGFGFYTEAYDMIPVYTANMLSLLQKEAKGEVNGLEREWAALTDSHYGYWAALKRLGKAQEVTGCYDYELWLPFPIEVLMQNPNLEQNPGY